MGSRDGGAIEREIAAERCWGLRWHARRTCLGVLRLHLLLRIGRHDRRSSQVGSSR